MAEGEWGCGYLWVKQSYMCFIADQVCSTSASVVALLCICCVNQPQAKCHFEVDSSSRWRISTWTWLSVGEEVRTKNTQLLPQGRKLHRISLHVYISCTFPPQLLNIPCFCMTQDIKEWVFRARNEIRTWLRERNIKRSVLHEQSCVANKPSLSNL